MICINFYEMRFNISLLTLIILIAGKINNKVILTEPIESIILMQLQQKIIMCNAQVKK